MRCKDCTSFKTKDRMEAGRELSPDTPVRGMCDLTSRSCNSIDECGCDAGSKRK